MSFNLLKAPMRDWRRRVVACAAAITSWAPDVVGTQEGTEPFFERLHERSGYARVARGRNADGSGMQCAILYRADRLEVVDSGHFWLSPTPARPGTRPWLSPVPRMATWARFRDGAGRQFTCVNTHFNHFAGATQAVHLTRSMAALPRPWILTGDFNAFPLLGAHAVFRRHGLVDACQQAWWRDGTWHAYTGIPLARIDWILTTPEIVATQIEVVRAKFHGVYPSDHFPVAGGFEFAVHRS